MERRTLLGLMGLSMASGVAGCAELSGSGTEEPTTEPPTETPTATMTETETVDDTSESAGLITVTVDGGFNETVGRITDDIENSPLTLVTTIDHAANADTVDRNLPPTTVLIFGNPEIGTPLMQESRSVALDLPQRMLVWRDDDQVKVTYNDPEFLARRHGIEGETERIGQIRTVLDQLASGET